MPRNEEEEDDPRVTRLLVIFLRGYAGLTQTALGKVTGIGQAAISRYEIGKDKPRGDSLRRIADAAGIPWPVARDLGRCFAAVVRSIPWDWESQELDAGLLDAILEPARIALLPYRIDELGPGPEPPSPEEQRREAEEIWTNLQAYPMSRRRHLIELARGVYPAWALAERICEASLRTAEDEPDQARELVDLALLAAGSIEDGGQRSRVEGYCWAHLAHARRAAHDLAGAAEASARAWSLWQAGAGGDFGLLPEERVAALEATLTSPAPPLQE